MNNIQVVQQLGLSTFTYQKVHEFETRWRCLV